MSIFARIFNIFSYINYYWWRPIKCKFYIFWTLFIIIIISILFPLTLPPSWGYNYIVEPLIESSALYKIVNMTLVGISLPLFVEAILDYYEKLTTIIDLLESMGNVFYIGVIPLIINILSLTGSLTTENYWTLTAIQRCFLFAIFFGNLLKVTTTTHIVSDLCLIMVAIFYFTTFAIYFYVSFTFSSFYLIYAYEWVSLINAAIIIIILVLLWPYALFITIKNDKWRKISFDEFKAASLLFGFLFYTICSTALYYIYHNETDDYNDMESGICIYAGIVIVHALIVTILPGRAARRLIEKERETLTIKREFVKSISNEITSPLYVSHVSLEVLKAQLQSDNEISLEKVIDKVNNIYYSNQTALSIMNDLLQYENIDTGTFQLNTKIIVLKNSFKGRFIPLLYIAEKYLVKLLIFDQIGTSEYYTDSGMSNDNNNNLFNAIDSHIDDATKYSLSVDISTVDQMLRNLLYTMVKNTPSGGTISMNFKIIQIIENSIKKSYLSIEFIYMSIINENDENEDIKDFNVIIFNPNKPSTNGSDTGMDLWIAKKIIEAHNGTFDFSCDLNRRNPKFVVNLPLVWCCNSDNNNYNNNNLDGNLNISISQSLLANVDINVSSSNSKESKCSNDIEPKNNSYSNSLNYNKVFIEESNEIVIVPVIKEDASKIIQYDEGILDMIKEIYTDNNTVSKDNNTVSNDNNNNINNNNNNNQQSNITQLTNFKESVKDNNDDPEFFIYSKSISLFPIEKIPIQININYYIKSNDFFEVTFLKSGSCSDVFTAIYQEKQVIVKMLKREFISSQSACNQFQIELEILTRCNHNNIINIYGRGVDPRPFVVLEYLQGGTLDEKLLYLSNIIYNNKTNKYDHQKKIIEYSLTIAKAMKYLHSEMFEGLTIIHRDLKPENIGFTSDGIIKIFDFGLASTVMHKQNQSDVYQLSGFTGSIRYMAPEVALQKPYSEKVDVYSFGVLLWQMITLQKPYSYVNNNVVYGRVVLNGERPIITSDFPKYLNDLLTQCWDKDYNNRPDFHSIVHSLEEIIYLLKK